MEEVIIKKVNFLVKRVAKNETESKKKRVAVYCRVSTSHDEQIHSFNAQLNYYATLYENNDNYKLYKIYADEGISGTQVKNRTQFLQMIDDCYAGLIDCVVTKSISRFGRNTIDTLSYTRKLKEIGVDVYFEKEGIHSINAEGELMLAILSTLAETESVNISEAVKWGVRRCYEKGKIESLTLGKFYGYYKKGKEIVIVENEAEIIRRIYNEFLEGYGIYEIVKRLTSEEIITETGNSEWVASTVKKILSNEKYKGDCLFQKTFISNPLTHKRTKNNGELNMYYVEDCFPAIVDKDTWELVQLEYARQEKYREDHYLNKTHSGTDMFPFSNKIICGVCGKTYRLYAYDLRDLKGIKYFRCSTFIGKKWTEIPDKWFTPRGLPRRTDHPKNKSYKHKPPKPRVMRCTDIEILYDKPSQAFINAWNYLVDNPDILKEHKAKDKLKQYRINELKRLIEINGKIDGISFSLIRQVLESMVVNLDGTITVRFLSGIIV